VAALAKGKGKGADKQGGGGGGGGGGGWGGGGRVKRATAEDETLAELEALLAGGVGEEEEGGEEGREEGVDRFEKAMAVSAPLTGARKRAAARAEGRRGKEEGW